MTLTYNSKLIRYLFNGFGIERAKDELYREADERVAAYKENIRRQAETLQLLDVSLSKPEGSTDRILAERMLEELRREYPKETVEADGDRERDARLFSVGFKTTHDKPDNPPSPTDERSSDEDPGER